MILCVAAAAAVTAAMLLAWAVQRALGNAGWVDVVWTFATGLALAGVALAAPGVPWRRLLLAGMLLLWAARLGGHVAWRVASSPEDTRYALMRAAAGERFQRLLLLLVAGQGIVAGLLGISILLAAAQPAADVRAADALGLALFLLGWGGEALADKQLRDFRKRPENAGLICERGLWGRSRHPNYFFEIVGWCGYAAIGVRAELAGGLLAFTAPLVMYLVLRYATGVPPLEAAMLKRRGDAYRRYQQRASAIIPRLF